MNKTYIWLAPAEDETQPAHAFEETTVRVPKMREPTERDWEKAKELGHEFPHLPGHPTGQSTAHDIRAACEFDRMVWWNPTTAERPHCVKCTELLELASRPPAVTVLQ